MIPPRAPMQNSSANGNEQSGDELVIQSQFQNPVEDDSDTSEPEIKRSPLQKRVIRTQPRPAIKVHTLRHIPLDLWLTRTICLSLAIAFKDRWLNIASFLRRYSSTPNSNEPSNANHFTISFSCVGLISLRVIFRQLFRTQKARPYTNNLSSVWASSGKPTSPNCSIAP